MNIMMVAGSLVPAWLATCLFTSSVMSGKVTNPSKVPKKAMLLSQVSSLTLRDGKSTSSRRVDAVSQLQCVGPREICDLYRVDVMRCVNEGADYEAENIQWSCKASLPEEVKLGSTDVICEGYESSDDPYVLKGSCAVEYRLLLTDKGEQRYGRLDLYSDVESPASESKIPALIFLVVFAGVLFVILKAFWTQWRTNPPPGRGGRRHGGGNYGGNDDDDPPPYDGPPPYSDQPSQPKTRPASTKTSTRSTASSSRSATQGGQQQGWRPGFWTGTAAGAAAGYLAGSRGQARTEPGQTTAARPQSETQQRPSTWFNNSANSQRQQGPIQPPSHSATRHGSTGFGETRRR